VAITIDTDLPEYNPIYNIMEVAVSSTNTAQPSFQYIFDIVTEFGGTFTVKVTPEPITGLSLGYQDVSQIIEEFVKERIAEFNSVGNFVQGLDEMIMMFHIEYGEEYEVAGVLTEFKNLTTGTDKYAWCASFPKHEWIDERINPNAFITWRSNIVNGTSAEFLTRLKTKKTSIGDLGWTYLMTDTVADIDKSVVNTYDSSGALIATFEIANLQAMGATVSRVSSLASSPQSLNNISAPHFLVGAQPVITSSVASYDIQVQDSAGNPATEIITFEIEEPCKDQSVRLHWINELGGFDSFNFDFRNQESQENEKKKYTRNKTNISGLGITYKHEDNGTVAYYVQNRDKILARSSFLTTEEHRYLKELISSPLVYLEFEAKGDVKNFKQVYINNSVWTDQTNEYEKLVRLDLNIDIGLINIRQRR